MKQACQASADKAKASKAPIPDCVTADGIVLAYVQNDAEKRACSKSLFTWWKKQQEIQASAANMKADGHPKSGRASKEAGWP